MPRKYILIARVPIIEPDTLKWARWFDNIDNRRVRHTDFPDGSRVSTVFLGLDHRYTDDGPPLLFETMIFPGQEFCERYSTWEEAVAGHERAVRMADVILKAGGKV